MTKKKIILIILSILLIGLIIASLVDSTQNIIAKDIKQFKSDIKTSNSPTGYANYVINNPKKYSDQIAEVPLANIDLTQSLPETYSVEGMEIITDDESLITFKFTAPKEGFYNLELKYTPIIKKIIGTKEYLGKTSEIERQIRIDGKSPFDEARTIKLSRIFYDDFSDPKNKKFKINASGDEIRPKQLEKKDELVSILIGDYDLKITEPYKFYLTQGEHTLTIEGNREPVLINAIKFIPVKKINSYDKQLEIWKSEGKQVVDKETVIIQEAEYMSSKGTPVLIPLLDSDSPKAFPYNTGKNTKLNVVGIYSWRLPGYWISYDIEAPKEGLYQLTLRGKQDIKPSSFVSRQVKINDEIQYEEATRIPLNNSSKLNNYTIGTRENPYLFYLKKGINKIEFKVSLGNVGGLINQTKDAMNDLNKAYLDIIKYTSTSPDEARTYDIEKTLPHLLPTLKETKNKLQEVVSSYVKINNNRQGQVSIINTLIYQIDRFIKNIDGVIFELGSFQSNISALGTWVLNEQEQPFTMDSFIFHSPEYKVRRARPNIFETIWQNLTKFIYSFRNKNYTSGKTGKKVRVWVTSGRDNVQILRRIIDEGFEKDIAVDLELVPKDALLRATVSGQGPDVALMVAEGTPIDFAFRKAAYDLTNFSDYTEVIKEFKDSALVPFKFTQKGHTGLYALPEQQTFPVLFYRKDIFKDYGLTPPKTWDEAYKVMNKLNENNLDFFIESGSTSLTDLSTGGISNTVNSGLFGSILYQHGGSFYNTEGTKSALTDKKSLDAFKMFTDFFTKYRLEKQANFVNRFRSGEMAAGITDYQTYNTLVVFAPEISDKWAIAEVPGLEDTPEKNVVTSKSLSSAIMLQSAKDKEAAWEFMKWWVSSETQVNYAKELETILGAAARYTTANVVALKQLSWPVKDLKVISTMMDRTRGIPQVPGGYMTTRQFTYAFLKVVINSHNPYEILNEYVEEINNEISRKRKEFNLD